MTTPRKPPITRQGRTRLPETRLVGKTYKVPCGLTTGYVTINTDADGIPREMFAKWDEGYQGMADGLALTASLAMQYGCPMDVILNKWRGMRFPPDGINANSIPDAIARTLTKEKENAS